MRKLQLAKCFATVALAVLIQPAPCITHASFAARQPATPAASASPTQLSAHLDLGKDPIVVKIVPDPRAEAEAKDKSDSDKSLVNATWGLVGATVFLFIATAALFGVTAWMAREAKRTGTEQAAATKIALDNAADSLRVAQAELKASHRPWLKFTVRPYAPPPETVAAGSDDRGFHLNLVFEMENVGNEPAFNATPELELTAKLFGDERQQLLDAQQKLIRRHEQGAVNMGSLQGGLTIFPGEKLPIHLVNISIPAQVMTDALANDPLPAAWLRQRTGFDWLECNIVGCIFYRASDQSFHRTGFAYELGVVDGFVNGCNLRVGVPLDAPGLTPEKLLLRPKYWHGNVFAAT